MKNWKKWSAAGVAAVMMASSLSVVAAEADAESAYDANNPPIAATAQGQVMGYMDDDTYAFLGIPYATAERFEAPQAVEPWEGVRSAQAYGPVSPIPDQTEVGAMRWYGRTVTGFRMITART